MFRHSASSHARKGWPKALFLPVALLLMTALLVMASPSKQTPVLGPSQAEAQTNTAYKVPVTLYVMSRCPDAKFCQNAFKPVLETLPSVAAVRTEYIARLADEDTVQCMHGQAECDGNKQQLCLQHHLPAAENRKFFQTLLCHSKGPVNDVKVLQGCMQDAGIAASTQADVLKCIEGTLGATLQVGSAKQVTANSVVKSCTVMIDGAKRCIRDGGTWYDCPAGSDTQAFIKTICDTYKAKQGKAAAECDAALGSS